MDKFRRKMFKGIKEAYLKLASGGEFMQPYVLLLIRLYWGILFYFSGLGKLNNLKPTVSFFKSIHIPFPEISAQLVGYIEMIGGIFLAAGFLSSLTAFLLIIVMLTAYFTAHFDAVRNIFNSPQEFVSQPPFNFLLASLIVFMFGPGKVSIDYWISRFILRK